ncbi:MAG TPA: hypothetical protein VGC36_09995, partial [Rhizomicrobium sp.]
AVSNCHDLSGAWYQLYGPEQSLVEHYSQDGSFVETSSLAGSIDLATGAFSLDELPRFPANFPSPGCFWGGLDGQLSADDTSFAATGVFYQRTLMHCLQVAVSLTGTRCGNAVIDAGEQCDDGDLADGDGCSSTCQVDSCWTCTGVPSLCSPRANGTACALDNACVTGRACSAGVCGGGTAVTCDACLACDPAAGCIVAPRSDCGAAGRSSATLSSSPVTGADKLSWRWLRGAAVDLVSLGNPTTGTDYDVCVYDESGAAPTLLLHAAAPAGAGWRPAGSGFSYRGTTVRTLKLNAGAARKSKALLKLKGDLPAPPFATPLTVQVQGDGAACFATTFEATDVTTNTGARFKASR